MTNLVDGEGGTVGHGGERLDKHILTAGPKQSHQALSLVQGHHPGFVVQAVEHLLQPLVRLLHHRPVQAALLRVVGTQVVAVPVQGRPVRWERGFPF